jgi:hypothetical protein
MLPDDVWLLLFTFLSWKEIARSMRTDTNALRLLARYRLPDNVWLVLISFLSWKEIAGSMLTDTYALRLLARHMNKHDELRNQVAFESWKEVAPLLRSMQCVRYPYWEVAPLRQGCDVYWISDCCALRNLALFDRCESLSLEADFFCEDCCWRVFQELGHWKSLTQLHLQINSRLNYQVVYYIEQMWQGEDQLTAICLGDIVVDQEDQERIVAAFGNLRIFDTFFSLPRDWR